MLHDPGSYVALLSIRDITLSQPEMDRLRTLAEELSCIASLPAQAEIAELWRRLNDLQSSRPMVWINEIPWHEMNVDDELTLRAVHPWARELESRLLRTLYQARHLPADMVVRDFIECPLAIHSTDYGIVEDVDIARTDAASDIYSRHFHIQIREPRDIEKIRMPVVTHDTETTAVVRDAMERLFSDIMPVCSMGQTHIWFAPWDYLIRWWGEEEAMVDLVERPEMVNAAVERLVDAWMVELDQLVALNLLSLDCDNTRIGSGGYGYASGLPGSPTTQPESFRPTCGDAPTRRSSTRFHPRCAGSSRFATTFAGLQGGSSPIMGAASRWTGRSSSFEGFRISGRSR
jgi:hypothetical protein